MPTPPEAAADEYKMKGRKGSLRNFFHLGGSKHKRGANEGGNMEVPPDAVAQMTETVNNAIRGARAEPGGGDVIAAAQPDAVAASGGAAAAARADAAAAGGSGGGGGGVEKGHPEAEPPALDSLQQGSAKGTGGGALPKPAGILNGMKRAAAEVTGATTQQQRKSPEAAAEAAAEKAPAPKAAAAAGDKKPAAAAAAPIAAAATPAEVKPRAPRGRAVVALAGVKGGEEVLQGLRKRGFVVHVATRRSADTMDVALGLGPKLVGVLVVEESMETKKEYTRPERTQLSVAAMALLNRIPDLQYDECFLLHEKDALERLQKHSSPDDIAEYFGSGLGIYFSFLQFYTQTLRAPAIAGTILFLSQMLKGYTSPLGPLFCVGMALWSTMFLEFWKRHCAATTYRWGVHGAENQEELQELAAEKKTEVAPPKKVAIAWGIIAAAILVCIQVMLVCVRLSQVAERRYGAGSILRFLPVGAYSLVPIACSQAYGKLANRLNDYEGHITERQKQNALTLKLFAFQFVNFFCALFYIGFFLRDMPRLSGMLFSLCVTKQLSGNAFEVGLPLLRQKYAEYRAQKELKAAQAAAAAPSDAQRAIAPPPDTDDARGASGSGTAVATSAAAAPGQLGPIVLNDEVLTLADFEAQLVADQFVISDEYLELAIQFGFSTMFAVAFPLAPLFAYVNNVAEYKIDLHALKQARRPTPVVASSIGTWITCLEAMGFFATFTNCCLMVFLGRSMDHFLPEEFHSALDRLEVRALLALGMEHILLAVKFILAGVVDDEPLWVKEALAKKELEERDTTKRLRLIAAGMKEPPPIVEDPKVVERNNAIAALRKVRKESEPWSFNPMWYAALIALPYMVSAYGLDYVWAVPLAAMIVGYMQHEKDKAEVGLTTGEIHDSSIKALIARELPKWFSDSETERVEWLNKLLQHMWPHASGATDAMVREMVDPMLAEYKPAAIDKLGFRVISLGTIAPRVVGIRTFDSNESCVVLDMEMKWNGNPKIVIEVGRSPLPITITLSNIRFSGKVRAELSPLVPLVPCFGNLSVCFMERPYVDFTFQVGAVDLMSLGPAELNIASAVSAVTKMVLQDIVPVLYPQKMVIPIIEPKDLAGLAAPAPTGVLQLEVVGADNLRKADLMGKSDPYVVIKLGEEENKTSVINSNLNPRWGEKFDILVHDKASQVVTFDVYDEDLADNDDHLGRCEVPLSALLDFKITALNVPLTSTPTGSLLLKLEYVPLQAAPGTEKEDLPDVVFDQSPEELTDELVASEEVPMLDETPDFDLANMGADSMGKLLPAKEQRKGSMFNKGLKMIPTKQLGGALKAVSAVVTLGALGGDDIPAEPMAFSDPSDRSMGVLTIQNISVSEVKAAKMYCIVQQGNSQRKTQMSEKATEASWLMAVHMLIRGSKTAQVEIAVMQKGGLTASDTEVGRVKLRIEEIVSNDNALEREWPLLGEKAVGSMKFKAVWTPAAIPAQD